MQDGGHSEKLVVWLQFFFWGGGGGAIKLTVGCKLFEKSLSYVIIP